MTELHVHLDGSIRPETVFELAKRQGVETGIPGLYRMPKKDAIGALAKVMTVPQGSRDLNDYLECFRLPLAVLQEEDAIERTVTELGEDLFRDGVTRAEIRFAPLSCCTKGMQPKDAIRAAERGARTAMRLNPGLSLSLIICCMRGQEEAPFLESGRQDLTGEDVNFRLVDLVADLRNDVVKAVDLAGAEALYPTERYLTLFRHVKERELPFTIHAGEAAGARSVRAAMDAGAMRIGHGVRVIENRLLAQTLVVKKITLECCLTSNFQTRVFRHKEDHPVKRLFDMGVRVTLNTDNRTVSDTSMQKEIETAQRMFGFTDENIRTMQEYAAEALF